MVLIISIPIFSFALTSITCMPISLYTLLIYSRSSFVSLFVFMYFMMIRPQQKEEKKKALMLNELAVGDTVLTTRGFYGTIIDISDDTVIVEFGNNRNCRIPMQKAAVAMVEKPEDAQ